MGGEFGGLYKGEKGLGGGVEGTDGDAACVWAVGFKGIRSDKQNESIGCVKNNKQVPRSRLPKPLKAKINQQTEAKKAVSKEAKPAKFLLCSAPGSSC